VHAARSRVPNGARARSLLLGPARWSGSTARRPGRRSPPASRWGGTLARRMSNDFRGRSYARSRVQTAALRRAGRRQERAGFCCERRSPLVHPLRLRGLLAPRR
jgi:hypothetical protein